MIKNRINSLIQKAWETKASHAYSESLNQLEEAHLLSQPYALAHFRVHWEMFKLALYFKEWRELIGQIPRLLLAVPGSLMGLAPQGNVGSTKMGIFEKRIK